jgi:16S rRNA (uracil1498-N3)-methyltransferase
MSQLHRFFYDGPLNESTTVSLDADTAKHIWQVLRMEAGDRVALTDGKGTLAEGSIHIAERHKCNVTLEKVTFHPRPGGMLHLCVAFTKNNSRNEWLLEKTTELGVASIIPIAASRSEKTHMRHDRWHKILQSAILQSQQHYLPFLAEVTPLKQVIAQYSGNVQKLIAHCIADGVRRPFSEMLNPTGEAVLLIGPEGDFAPDEVNLCMQHGFSPVSLGNHRLRTETAAITAAAFFNVMNDGKS